MSFWENPNIIEKEHPIRRWILLLNVILPTMIAIYSAVATIVVQNSIVGGMALDGMYTPWITILYLLGANTIVPVANRIADRIGYKKLYFIGVILFFLGTLGTSLAFNFTTLGLSRLIEGVGAGFVFPVGMAIIVRNFSGKELNLALNLYLGLGFGVGLGLGGLLPGYFAMYQLWQYGFLITLPVILISLLIILFFHIESEKVNHGKFDYLGFLFFSIAISSLLIALSEGNLKSTAEGWRAPFIIACFLLFFLAITLVIFIEKRAENPIIPLEAFKDPTFSIGCITLFALGMTIFSSFSMMVSYMENGLLYDKLTAGANMLSYGIAMGLFSMIANILLKKFSPTFLSITGLSIVIFSLFLNNILTIQSGKLAIFSILFIKGAGVGLALGPTTAHALHHLSDKLKTDGATLLTFFRQVGGTYGGSILGIILIRRQIFHDQLFSATVNPHLSGFKYTMKKLTNHMINTAGLDPHDAAIRAKGAIINTIEKQSLIQSINDSFLTFGYIITGITALIIVINFLQRFSLNSSEKKV